MKKNKKAENAYRRDLEEEIVECALNIKVLQVKLEIAYDKWRKHEAQFPLKDI